MKGICYKRQNILCNMPLMNFFIPYTLNCLLPKHERHDSILYPSLHTGILKWSWRWSDGHCWSGSGVFASKHDCCREKLIIDLLQVPHCSIMILQWQWCVGWGRETWLQMSVWPPLSLGDVTPLTNERPVSPHADQSEAGIRWQLVIVADGQEPLPLLCQKATCHMEIKYFWLPKIFYWNILLLCECA